MGWLPLQGVHAIERVRITMMFRDPIPARQADLIATDLETRRVDFGFLPILRHQDQPQVHIVIGPGAPPISGPTGWELRRPGQEENQILEVAALNGSIVSFESADYDRWISFSDRMLALFGGSLKRVSEVVGLIGVNLEYFDRFVYDGEVEKASPLDLLVDIERLLPQDALSGRQPWHLHRGWYEDNQHGRILVNKNFDVQDGEDPNGKAVRSVQIYTKTEQQFVDPVYDLNDLFGFLNPLHERNNSLFFSALQSNVSEVFSRKEKENV